MQAPTAPLTSMAGRDMLRGVGRKSLVGSVCTLSKPAHPLGVCPVPAILVVSSGWAGIFPPCEPIFILLCGDGRHFVELNFHRKPPARVSSSVNSHGQESRNFSPEAVRPVLKYFFARDWIQVRNR